MLFRSIILLFFLCINLALAAQIITQPIQPISGPGGSDYIHNKVIFQDFAEDMEGYWLFEPAEPRPLSAPVVVFMHGYGAYNPMVYGEWIRHLVRKGNIVIFPRYQENMFYPLPKDFADNSAKAIKNALKQLSTGNHVRPITNNLAFVGHSFGGAITANLAVNHKSFGIPKPSVAMLCSPGTGWVTMGLLDSYAELPEDLKLLVVVSEDDNVVEDKFGRRIFSEAINTCNKNFIRQFRDYYGSDRLSAHHNETYSLLTEYDSGHRTTSSIRAIRISKTNAMDYYGYWKWLDALLACDRKDAFCEYAFGNTPEQRNLGTWSDGTKIKEVEVILSE